MTAAGRPWEDLHGSARSEAAEEAAAIADAVLSGARRESLLRLVDAAIAVASAVRRFSEAAESVLQERRDALLGDKDGPVGSPDEAVGRSDGRVQRVEVSLDDDP
jgi:hypothetical protein